MIWCSWTMLQEKEAYLKGLDFHQEHEDGLFWTWWCEMVPDVMWLTASSLLRCCAQPRVPGDAQRRRGPSSLSDDRLHRWRADLEYICEYDQSDPAFTISQSYLLPVPASTCLWLAVCSHMGTLAGRYPSRSGLKLASDIRSVILSDVIFLKKGVF